MMKKLNNKYQLRVVCHSVVIVDLRFRKIGLLVQNVVNCRLLSRQGQIQLKKFNTGIQKKNLQNQKL